MGHKTYYGRNEFRSVVSQCLCYWQSLFAGFYTSLLCLELITAVSCFPWKNSTSKKLNTKIQPETCHKVNLYIKSIFTSKSTLSNLSKLKHLALHSFNQAKFQFSLNLSACASLHQTLHLSKPKLLCLALIMFVNNFQFNLV